ncbi:MAG: hypothetical protein RLZZ142_1902 [Verrucomicrobiota bacterium]
MKQTALLLVSVLALLARASGQVPELPPKLAAFLDAHCSECHDSDTHKGGLDLSRLPWSLQAGDHFQQWTKVFDKIERGEMPPKKKERPAAAQTQAFLKNLGSELHAVSLKRQQQEGRVVRRRLSRSEYLHTIQDLLGVDSGLRELLPEDEKEGGFENIGSALNLSEIHLERYLQAADLALLQATVRSANPESQKLRTDYTEQWQDSIQQHEKASFWTFSPEGFLAMRVSSGRLEFPHLWTPPVPDALYRFRVRVRAMMEQTTPEGVLLKNAKPDPRMMLRMGLTRTPGTSRSNVYFEASPTEFREFECQLRPQLGEKFYVGPYRVIPEAPGQEGAILRGSCLVVEWVEFEGPLSEEWPTKGHRLLYGDLPLRPRNPANPGKDLRVVSANPETDARTLVGRFLTRVFRRPAEEAEIEEHVRFAMDKMHQGKPFDEALRSAYKLALCAPEFLFLDEKPGPLTDHAIASRLSYALWGTSPDDVLRTLAAQGQLHEPGILREQTERLLKDPRSRRFTQSFLGSWLNLREIDFTQPDVKLYPEFEHYLQVSMLGESEAFFEAMLQGDLSVSHVVQSPFAILNERLAEHYGIPGVRGDFLRRVELPPGSHRGGVITQGAPLKVSANGTTTSPVVRGAYILERILGTPPDPPPKNVAAIEPDIRGATTIREQLDKHRSQPACASCHAKLDPPGFALESFDVTGRWRTHYRKVQESEKTRSNPAPGAEWRFYTQGPPVNPSYTLEDGQPFADVDEFKQLLLAHPEQLARCLAGKLMTHLTGARPEFADREVIEEIVQRCKAKDYGLRTLLHEIIQSRVFRCK